MKTKQLKPDEQKENFDNDLKGNFVSVGSEIIVHSHTASLKKVEKTVDRLIKKHGEFISFKRKSKLISGGSCY